ncbi:MAG: hypothetical protein QM784_09135 [Polyangiaceae bacterium]
MWRLGFPTIGSAALFVSTALPASSERVTWFAAGLRLERDLGAEHCPDKAAVLAAMVRLFPEIATTNDDGNASKAPLEAVVRIRPIPTGHEATVSVSSPRIGERIIIDEEPDCRGLEDALALALVMLSDPSDHSPEPLASAPLASAPLASAPLASAPLASAPNPPVAASAPVASARPSEAVTTTDRQKQPAGKETKVASAHDDSADRMHRAATKEARLRIEGKGQGVGAIGLLGKPALGLGLGFDGYTKAGLGMSLMGTRLWAQPVESHGGRVALSLWALSAGPCWRQPLGTTTAFDGCLLLGVGRQRAEVSGFVNGQSASYRWWILEPHVAVGWEFTRGLRAFWGLGGSYQLSPQSFSVIEQSTARRIEAVGAPGFGLAAEIGVSFGNFGI